MMHATTPQQAADTLNGSVKAALFSVAYDVADPSELLARQGTLAVFEFGRDVSLASDPRHVRVSLPALDATVSREYWSVAAPVEYGAAGPVRWATGGGWRLTVVELEEAGADSIEAVSEQAYNRLLSHVAASPESRLQRIWNYLGAINEGTADHERYRLFCNGRARGMAAHGVSRYPAATAIGHHGPRGLLQVYALSAVAPGHAMENPRQVSAWQYPRQYGPTAPSFARAMLLSNSALAISGTAAVIGHASHHAGDVAAQVDEAFANLASLLERVELPAFDASSPLKVYVRQPRDANAVRTALARHLDPAVPRVLLQGDICRRELLVEIDGWRFTD